MKRIHRASCRWFHLVLPKQLVIGVAYATQPCMCGRSGWDVFLLAFRAKNLVNVNKVAVTVSRSDLVYSPQLFHIRLSVLCMEQGISRERAPGAGRMSWADCATKLQELSQKTCLQLHG
eukprot:1735723-Pleurochrysis_carterae.AAC.4